MRRCRAGLKEGTPGEPHGKYTMIAPRRAAYSARWMRATL
jgi:hypothetical protein